MLQCEELIIEPKSKPYILPIDVTILKFNFSSFVTLPYPQPLRAVIPNRGSVSWCQGRQRLLQLSLIVFIY